MRRLIPSLVLSLLALPLAAQPIPEPNVNMVAGQQWPGGDPFLQRQNEPSFAVSTRNPLHLLAGANDYRTVDLPFDTTSPDDEERGDAWLGVFKSKNGGQTWWSNMLPGYPQDLLSNSPLHGYQAGADPVVRSGANGMFYYSGIVLNRDVNPLGGVFVARFIDNNNTENGDPIAHLDDKLIATGSSGQFIDKPWLAVGPGTGTCTITQGLNTQTFPAQNVYLAYTIFVGNDNNIKTKLMFQRSTDCGATWGNPTKLSESFAINQGATIAVAPNGSVYVVWRRFKSNNESNAIMIAKSTDKGATFGKGAVVREITPFEQGMTYYSIRTNAYPAAAVDDSSNLYVVWSDRSFHPQQDGRIVMMRSADGVAWTQPVIVDNAANRGHQFMPAITITGGKVVIAYYDLRDDSTQGVFTPILFPDMTPTGQFTESRVDVGDRTSAQTALQFVFTQYLLDTAAHRHHTLDLRATQANTGLQSGFTGTTRVSTYVFGSRPGNGKRLVEQLQYNPPNLPMFRLGTAPFIGDYIDITGYTTKSTHVYHVGWTDNRDVRPPLDGNWANFTALTSLSKPALSRVNGQPVPACVVGQTGMRNQNIYTARLTDGLFVGSPGNAKQLIDKNNQPITRAFVVFVQNSTKSQKTFRLTAQQPAPGQASFQQFSLQSFVDVTIPPRSSATRTVYVSSTNAHATANVDVTEYASGSPVQGGLTSSVVINPDVSNPDVSNPDVSNADLSNPDVSNPDVSNPDVSNVEVHNPDVSNPDVSNPDVSNPDVSNPDVSNPDVSNPDVSNPDVSNPDVSNPDVSNPDVSNPDVSNPDVSNASVSDTTWTAHNKGNTTSGYAVKLATNQPVPTGVRTQLIINRVYQTPISRDCTLGVEKKRQIIANLLDPQFTDFGSLLTADPNDSTLWLAPGDAARITLRVYNPDPIGHPFNPATAIAPAVIAHAVASNGNANTPPAIALPLFITTNTVGDAIAGNPYTTTIAATGGIGTRTWTVLTPQGFTAPNGVVSGTFANPGDITLTVQVTDAAVPPHVAQRSYVVHVIPPIQITTASPMRGMTGEYFAVTLQATGGTAPYTWSVANGAIPSGLALNPSTGFITQGQVGQLVAGDTGVTFRVTDAANQTTTKLLTFHIVDPLFINSPIPNAATGTPYTTTLSSTGGFGTKTWSLAPNVSQPGISLTAAGVLSATFNVAGPQTVSVQVADSDTPPQIATRSVALTVIDSGFTVQGRLKYNGALRVPTAPPQFFLRNEVTFQQQNGATVVWNNDDTITISGVPAGTYGVEVISNENQANGSNYPGDFYSFTTFDAATAAANGFDITLTRLIHVNTPIDNGVSLGVPLTCPPSTSLIAPNSISWDPIDVPATYTWQIVKSTCSFTNQTVVASGSTAGTTGTFNTLPPSIPGEFYILTMFAFAGNTAVGQIMDHGTNGYGWDLRFTVAASSVTANPTTAAAGFGQLVALDVVGLTSLNGVTVHFQDPTNAGSDGFIFNSPSSPARIYVRLPSGLADGPIVATVNQNAAPIAAVNMTQSTQPGTPQITAIRSTSSGSCAPLGPGPADTLTAGQGVGIGAFGTDTTNAEAMFTQGQSSYVVSQGCPSSSASIGLVTAFALPPQIVAGPLSISIRTTVNGVQSFWSPAVTTNVQ